MSCTTIDKARFETMCDIDRFEAGEVPSPEEMKRAPRIEQWRLFVVRIGKLFIMRADGSVYNHDLYRDGSPIRTSGLVWVDRHHRFVRTGSRIYMLGEHAGDPIALDGVDIGGRNGGY